MIESLPDRPLTEAEAEALAEETDGGFAPGETGIVPATVRTDGPETAVYAVAVLTEESVHGVAYDDGEGWQVVATRSYSVEAVSAVMADLDEWVVDRYPGADIVERSEE